MCGGFFIPKTIESKNLEQIVCKIFNSIGFDIDEDRIESCHRLKFSGNKHCQHLMLVRKGLERSRYNKPEFFRGHQNRHKQ